MQFISNQILIAFFWVMIATSSIQSLFAAGKKTSSDQIVRCESTLALAAKAGAQPQTNDFAAIESIIRNHFQGWKMGDPLGQCNTFWPFDEVNKAVLPGFRKLTQNERNILQSEVNKEFPDKSLIPAIFAVLLNPKTENAWVRLLGDTTTSNEKNFYSYTNFMKSTIEEIGPYLDEMSPKTRQHLLDIAAQKYLDAPKRGRNDAAFAPKRAIDMWIRVLIPADEVFSLALKKTKKPILAYQAYLDAVRTRFVNRMSKNKLLYGQLRAEDILSFAQIAQKSLRDSGYRGKEPRIAFHGSVIKGLSKKGSDLDALTLGLTSRQYGISPQQEFMLPRESNHTMPGTPADDMLNAAEEEFPDLDLRFSQPHTFTKEDDTLKYYYSKYISEISKMSLLEPFLVEVSPQSIDLLLIPSRNEDGSIAETEVNCDTGLNCVRYRIK